MKTPRRQHGSLQGFTLVEILIVVIILGILAALVVPQFSNAQSVTRAGTLKHELRSFRTQVMVYRAQHGVSPGHPHGNPAVTPDLATLAAQLTQFTNAQGQVSPTQTGEFRYGPYLERIPANSVNLSDAVRFLLAGDPLPDKPSGPEGWIYQPATATVIANAAGKDEMGVAFFDY